MPIVKQLQLYSKLINKINKKKLELLNKLKKKQNNNKD